MVNSLRNVRTDGKPYPDALLLCMIDNSPIHVKASLNEDSMKQSLDVFESGYKTMRE